MRPTFGAPRPEVGRGRALPRGIMTSMPLEKTGRAPESGLCARLRRARPVSAHSGDGPMALTAMSATPRDIAELTTRQPREQEHAIL